MIDRRFFDFLGPMTLAEAATLAAGTLSDSADTASSLSDICAVEAPAQGALAYAETRPSLAALAEAELGLIITQSKWQGAIATRAPCLYVDAPRVAFARIAERLFASRDVELDFLPADQRDDIILGAGVRIASGVQFGPDVEVSDGVHIGPNAVVGAGVRIGADSRIGAGAALSHTAIGERTRILPNAVIGEAGFGFAPTPLGLVRIPQFGRVLIGDDVEIGSNSTIDRGAIADTFIEDGAKIDNLVQIGHNTRIGRSAVLAGLAGVSGSCTIGSGAMLGGNAGIADHIDIGPGALIGAKAGVMKDVPAGERWAGMPARPARRHFREVAALARLAEDKGQKDGD